MPRRNRKRSGSSTGGGGGILTGLADQLHREWAEWVAELTGDYQEDTSNDDRAANRRGRNRRAQ